MNSPRPTPNLNARPLEGLVVGISVSAGEDAPQLGITEDAMNQLVIRLCDRLLAAGARLAFGHDWRPDGVMVAVAQLAARYQPETADTANRGCRITNFVAWDNQPVLDGELRMDLERRGMLRIVEIPCPQLPSPLKDSSDTKPILRALALSNMRAQLADLCDARICLGGKSAKFSGNWPGVLEEAWLTARRGQPLYLAGLLGGASLRLIDASASQNWGSLPRGKQDEALVSAQSNWVQAGLVDLPDDRQMPTLWGSDLLQQRSGLTPELWQRLTEARDIEIIASLVVLGLSRAVREAI